LSADQRINPTTEVTAGLFARWFVGERSRIPHGTQSTLSSRLGASRDSLAELAVGLLRSYAIRLDEYRRLEPSPADAVAPFLDWVKGLRAT